MDVIFGRMSVCEDVGVCNLLLYMCVYVCTCV